MDEQITISYPTSLALSLKMKNKEFEQEMKVISLIKLYELGKISSGFASNLLSITRLDFLELLDRYNVSYIASSEKDLAADFKNA